MGFCKIVATPSKPQLVGHEGQDAGGRHFSLAGGQHAGTFTHRQTLLSLTDALERNQHTVEGKFSWAVKCA